MNKVKLLDLGLIDYKECWDFQSKLSAEIISNKRAGKGNDADVIHHYLIVCQHPHVYTLGKSGSESNLLLNQQEREEKEVSYYKINRGGDITYHGPGQIVVYPIFDLDLFFTDVHRYVRSLEDIIIKVLADYGIEAGKIKDYTGVWIDVDKDHKRKICAIGVHLSRWVTMHGLAFNVNTGLEMFNHIIPCGIQERDKTVTSMEKELGEKLNINEVKDKIINTFANKFEFEYLT